MPTDLSTLDRHLDDAELARQVGIGVFYSPTEIPLLISALRTHRSALRSREPSVKSVPSVVSPAVRPTCEKCHGVGTIPAEKRCTACQGTGRPSVSSVRSVVRIP